MNKDTRKAAIVTGGSDGIGEAVAQRLASDGFAMAVNYAGNADKAQAVVPDIKAKGGKAIAVQGDVSNPQDVERLFASTREAFGRIDVVVNSAGIMPLSPISEGDVDAFDRTIAVNLRGTFLVLAQSAKHLGKGGRIIAVSSSVVAKSFPTYGAYIASKAGVEGLVHVLANELRGRDIAVNAIAPGPVATRFFLDGKSDELITQIANQAPMKRIGQPEEIASAVSFLAGPDGAWVNSQVVRVNGGFA
ncbi:MAG: SDR family oxidoreductase [Gammaproteobacteria bacterium]